MVDPSKSMWNLHFIVVRQISNVFSNFGVYNYICCGYAMTHKKHSGFKMAVDELHQILYLHSISGFDEAADFHSFLGVFFAEENLTKVD